MLKRPERIVQTVQSPNTSAAPSSASQIEFVAINGPVKPIAIRQANCTITKTYDLSCFDFIVAVSYLVTIIDLTT